MTPHLPRAIVKRQPNTHKGTYGHLLVIAGSVGLTGAPVLCAEAALRSGAGLVTLAVPKSIYPIIARKVTEAMVFPLPDGGRGSLTAASLRALKPLLKRTDTIALGPGLTTRPGALALVRRLLALAPHPMVIDADGVAALKGVKTIRRPQRAGGVVLTPHPGEMARLLGITTRRVQAQRKAIALETAQCLDVVVLLKGHRTVIANPDGKVKVNTTGNPGMAAGGMGDLLTGMIGAFIGQGMKPFEAAVAGAHLHGLAGDRAARRVGQVSLTAGDLLATIPRVIQGLSRRR